MLLTASRLVRELRVEAQEEAGKDCLVKLSLKETDIVVSVALAESYD